VGSVETGDGPSCIAAFPEMEGLSVLSCGWCRPGSRASRAVDVPRSSLGITSNEVSGGARSGVAVAGRGWLSASLRTGQRQGRCGYLDQGPGSWADGVGALAAKTGSECGMRGRCSGARRPSGWAWAGGRPCGIAGRWGPKVWGAGPNASKASAAMATEPSLPHR